MDSNFYNDFLGPLFGWMFILNIIPAIICSIMASSRGRNGVGGFVVGMIFGIFGIFYYLIVGDTVDNRVRKEEEARKKYSKDNA